MKAKIKLIDEEKEWNFMWVQKPQIKKKFSDRARAIVTRTKKKSRHHFSLPLTISKKKEPKNARLKYAPPAFSPSSVWTKRTKKKEFFCYFVSAQTADINGIEKIGSSMSTHDKAHR